MRKKNSSTVYIDFVEHLLAILLYMIKKYLHKQYYLDQKSENIFFYFLALLKSILVIFLQSKAPQIIQSNQLIYFDYQQVDKSKNNKI
jgi:hypothetical protein